MGLSSVEALLPARLRNEYYEQQQWIGPKPPPAQWMNIPKNQSQPFWYPLWHIPSIIAHLRHTHTQHTYGMWAMALVLYYPRGLVSKHSRITMLLSISHTIYFSMDDVAAIVRFLLSHLLRQLCIYMAHFAVVYSCFLMDSRLLVMLLLCVLLFLSFYLFVYVKDFPFSSICISS